MLEIYYTKATVRNATRGATTMILLTRDTRGSFRHFENRPKYIEINIAAAASGRAEKPLAAIDVCGWYLQKLAR
jgi:hypothetical protein